MCARCNKRPEFWRENHTPLFPLIGRIIFLTREKTSFAILIGRIIFVTCENHRSLLWLARTNLRTKIYDIAFWWVFLSMYIIKKCKRSDLGAESPHIKIRRVPHAIISSTFSFHNCPYGESTPFPLPLPRPKRTIRHVKGRTIRKVMGGGGGRGIFQPQEFFCCCQIPCMNFFQAIAWIFFRINWRAWIFFI